MLPVTFLLSCLSCLSLNEFNGHPEVARLSECFRRAGSNHLGRWKADSSKKLLAPPAGHILNLFEASCSLAKILCNIFGGPVHCLCVCVCLSTRHLNMDSAGCYFWIEFKSKAL